MDDEYLLVHVLDEGVLGVAVERPYGADVSYMTEDFRYHVQLETDEYLVLGIISEIDARFFLD